MQKMRYIAVILVWLAVGNLLAQAVPQTVDTENVAPLDAQREKQARAVRAMQSFDVKQKNRMRTEEGFDWSIQISKPPSSSVYSISPRIISEEQNPVHTVIHFEGRTAPARRTRVASYLRFLRAGPA